MCSSGSSKYWTPVNLTREGHVQYSTVAIKTFCLVCFEAVARELDDVSNNRLKWADVPGIRLPFNYNL